MIELDESNFEIIAFKSYNNPQCLTIEEFREDLSRIKYIKRLFTRYCQNDDLHERLILNHIIALYNVFDINECHRLILFKLNMDHVPVLKTFLLFLGFIEDNDFPTIPLDEIVLERLKKI